MENEHRLRELELAVQHPNLMSDSEDEDNNIEETTPAKKDNENESEQDGKTEATPAKKDNDEG